ncbi:MAG: hypothetical protein HS104_16685 [Polyangiaceae bacterium]|nr:hypothetical protein [Polyangiaceae bacterium]
MIGANVMRNFAVTLDDARSRFWLDDQRDESALLACTHAKAAPAEVSYVEADYLFVPGKAEHKPGGSWSTPGPLSGRCPSRSSPSCRRLTPAGAGRLLPPAAVGTFWAQLTAVGALEVAGHKVEHIVTRTIDDAMIPTPSWTRPFWACFPPGICGISS